MKTCDELVIGQQLESHISPTFLLSKEIEAFQAEIIIRLIYNNYIFQIYCSSTCNCIPALCRKYMEKPGNFPFATFTYIPEISSYLLLQPRTIHWVRY